MLSSQLIKTKNHPLTDFRKFYTDELNKTLALLDNAQRQDAAKKMDRLSYKIQYYKVKIREESENFLALLDKEKKTPTSAPYELKKKPVPAIHKKQPSCSSYNKIKKHLGKILLGIPAAISAIGDASSVGLGLRDMKEEKLLGFIESTDVTAVIIPVVYLLQTLAIYGSSTVESMQEAITLLSSGETPHDWPHISSNCKKYLVEAMAVLPVAYAAFSDAVGSYYYLKEENFHPAFGISLGIFTAITSLFSEGITSFKSLLAKFADGASKAEEPKSNNTNTIIKNIIHLLGIIGGIEDALNSYVSMAATFTDASRSVKNIFLAGSLGNGFCDYAFNNKIGLDAVESFLTTLSQRFPEKNEILAFSLALFTGCLLGQIQRAFFISMIATPEAALPFMIPDIASLLLGWGIGARGCLNNMIGVYPLYHKIIRDVFGIKDKTEPKSIELTDFKTSPTRYNYNVTLFNPIETKDNHFGTEDKPNQEVKPHPMPPESTGQKQAHDPEEDWEWVEEKEKKSF